MHDKRDWIIVTEEYIIMENAYKYILHTHCFSINPSKSKATQWFHYFILWLCSCAY